MPNHVLLCKARARLALLQKFPSYYKALHNKEFAYKAQHNTEFAYKALHNTEYACPYYLVLYMRSVLIIIIMVLCMQIVRAL